MQRDNSSVRNPGPSPVGYYDLHPDVGVNFQLNRFYDWVGDPTMLDEMRATAELTSYDALVPAYLALAEARFARGAALQGAAYLRIAEFFTAPGDPRKQALRTRFIGAVKDHYGVPAADLIPFGDGKISSYRFTPAAPCGTIVVFGGFDSYIEEWFRAAFTLESAGYDVVLFEGPGQGTPLEDFRLRFTPDWHLPVGAVFDHYGLDEVTLVGFSMGGGLVLRAAAHESRVARVVSYGVMSDLLDVQFHLLPAPAREQLSELLSRGEADRFNAVMAELESSSLLLEWGLKQGRHVTGRAQPFDVFEAYKSYETASVSPLVRQDALLLHGRDDHYIPIHQLRDQMAALSGVRSLTARIFTEDEQASHHCQVGNYDLALHEITAWLDRLSERDARLTPPD